MKPIIQSNKISFLLALFFVLTSFSALFAQTSGTLHTGEVTFSGSELAAVERPFITVELLLRGKVGTGSVVDRTSIYFSNDYNNAVADDDSCKFANHGETIGVMRDGTVLSHECRKLVRGTDSIPLKVWQLSQKSYTLRFSVENFASNIETYLVDNYLNKATLLSVGESVLPFNLTNDMASVAPDRFKIIFESFATLPVRNTDIPANAKSN